VAVRPGSPGEVTLFGEFNATLTPIPPAPEGAFALAAPDTDVELFVLRIDRDCEGGPACIRHAAAFGGEGDQGASDVGVSAYGNVFMGGRFHEGMTLIGGERKHFLDGTVAGFLYTVDAQLRPRTPAEPLRDVVAVGGTQGGGLLAVAVTPTDVFATGYYGYSGPDEPILFVYDHDLAIQATFPAPFSAEAIRAEDDGTAWLVGYGYQGRSLARFDGDGIVPVYLEEQRWLVDAIALSGSHVVVGATGAQSALLGFEQTATSVAPPAWEIPIGEPDDVALTALWGDAEGRLFVTGRSEGGRPVLGSAQCAANTFLLRLDPIR
jgi:hypothetical protein